MLWCYQNRILDKWIKTLSQPCIFCSPVVIVACFFLAFIYSFHLFLIALFTFISSFSSNHNFSGFNYSFFFWKHWRVSFLNKNLHESRTTVQLRNIFILSSSIIHCTSPSSSLRVAAWVVPLHFYTHLNYLVSPLVASPHAPASVTQAVGSEAWELLHQSPTVLYTVLSIELVITSLWRLSTGCCTLPIVRKFGELEGSLFVVRVQINIIYTKNH